jgi:hypothetical protein
MADDLLDDDSKLAAIAVVGRRNENDATFLLSVGMLQRFIIDTAEFIADKYFKFPRSIIRANLNRK